ncbi:FkbM family methyltransferase [Enterovirga sp. CN4-39]|uniref:FkbM family methyltransferase n=1 Tax=Enterovirga sp. CN4-39 TaxID=3400910 RepID=UPI003C091FDF
MLFSYAQIYEDVLLWRALSGRVQDGLYIDVGGFHPEVDSVTKLFYDHGWSGINIEPTPAAFALFERDRPRDINIRAAAWDAPGETTFHEIVGTGLSTSNSKYASAAEAEGRERVSYSVECRTLASICEEHVKDRPVHFLKVDCEGGEEAALKGADFTRWRPWIVLVEATEPLTSSPSYEGWEPILTAAGYEFVLTDDLNRFYVAPEHPELKSAFLYRADDYLKAAYYHEKEHLRECLSTAERELAEARRDIDNVRERISAAERELTAASQENDQLRERISAEERELAAARQEVARLIEELAVPVWRRAYGQVKAALRSAA